jgi:L-ascorbate metabolism protein UlaG (beta-lactamase superfamily)
LYVPANVRDSAWDAGIAAVLRSQFRYTMTRQSRALGQNSMWRFVRYAGLALALAALIAVGPVIYRLNRCVLDDLVSLITPTPPFFATFLGVSTLLIDDGTEALLIDGYFTRPTVSSGSSTVTPDNSKIDTALDTAQVTTTTTTRALRLAAVVVNHSHYDHAMDAPEVANKTDALLVGSTTTANIGRGRNVPVPEDRLRTFNATGESNFCLGRFRVTAVPTGHLQIPLLPTPSGEITTPSNPTTVDEYVEGGTYAIFVRRRARTMMVQGSAGFAPGALQGRRADVVYLAVAGLSSILSSSNDYWNETVGVVMPRRIFPIHWDPLGGPLTDDPQFQIGLNFAEGRANDSGIEFQKPAVGQKLEPFAGL